MDKALKSALHSFVILKSVCVCVGRVVRYWPYRPSLHGPALELHHSGHRVHGLGGQRVGRHVHGLDGQGLQSWCPVGMWCHWLASGSDEDHPSERRTQSKCLVFCMFLQFKYGATVGFLPWPLQTRAQSAQLSYPDVGETQSIHMKWATWAPTTLKTAAMLLSIAENLI